LLHARRRQAQHTPKHANDYVVIAFDIRFAASHDARRVTMHVLYGTGQIAPCSVTKQAGEKRFGRIHEPIMRNDRGAGKRPKRKPATRAGFHERHSIPAFAGMTYLR
jgi:hypothetical protein